ncbi:MAG: MBL fold metallo-hydrolase [Dermatophilaceae bacterium]|jgi:glyoxylase-like metal-dependent hydrolase (beta-lactamase superfamily II)|nr:MBL fold metallo-hydrolase [Actinomycetales bacterium]MBP8882023.1 MBL fold metallo-hydrolase [Dermatophilaceae bacterium]MBP9917971.1 MBL fold metallo-hydrolase [Dermatophilaceae bacterium]
MWSSRQVTARATCVLAPNPGVMTLDGTNTWVLREPGSDLSIVVDPGPMDQAHLGRVVDETTRDGGRVAMTLLTHDHADHAEAALYFADLCGTPLKSVRAIGSHHDDLTDGDRLRVGELEVVVVATPGHTGDSVSFLLPADASLLTGDTILGRGTTVVAWPDGELAAYLASLERLAALAGTGAVTHILPGHGPDLPDAAAVLAYYLDHRRERLEQVRAAVAAGAQTPRQVVETVYADVPQNVWGAAELSVRAQLDYLKSSPGMPGPRD